MSEVKRREGEMTREEAEQRVTQLMLEENFEEALRVCRYLADELHEHPEKLYGVLYHVMPGVGQLRAEDSGSSWCLLGEMHYWGGGGVQEDFAESYRCFSRAAERGHLMGLSRQGDLLWYGEGVEEDEEGGFRLMLRAAEAGCGGAYCRVGRCLEESRGVEQNRRRAAQWYLRAGTRETAAYYLRNLLREHSLEAAPLGEWQPRWHALVPGYIRECMRQTMLLGKRMRLPRDVALMIAEYVCTEGAEWERMIEEKGSSGSSSESE